MLSLVSGRVKRALIEGELYPFRNIGYCRIAEEESEVTTRELARSQVTTSDFGFVPWS